MSHDLTAQFLAEVRRDWREEIRFVARFRFGARTLDLSVLNVSARGLMAESADRSILPGEPVRVALPNIGEIGGAVRWCADGRLGIEFAETITLAGYIDLLADVTKR